MFRVIWSEFALDQLTDIFLESELEAQRRMADAVDALNRRLADDPFDQGESRDGPARVVFIDLLVVGFWINVPANEVRVEGVTQYGR